MLIVMKFGGSSLASAAHIRRAAELIADQRKNSDQVAVVVSAQGDTTDELITKAKEITETPPGRERDMLLSCGEQMSMALMAMQLEALGCPAVSFCGWQAGICTEARHGDARILKVEPHRVKQALELWWPAFRGWMKMGKLPPSAEAVQTLRQLLWHLRWALMFAGSIPM